MDRVSKVADLLRGLNIQDIMLIEEVDPQFECARAVCRSGGATGAASIFLAALAAYRLRCTGETYWRRFAEFFTARPLINDPVDLIVSFLAADPCSSLLKEAKIARVKKFTGRTDEVATLITRCDFRQLWALTSRILGSDPASKTVVFAVKMGYYCGRALRLCSDPLPQEIPIPVDSRVARATLGLGIISPSSVSDVATRCRDEIVRAWSIIGSSIQIPPLHIDSLLWALQNPETFSRAEAALTSKQALEAVRRLYQNMRT
jgi:DNA-(apurinic or apyrimidinic site) lyase